MTHQVRATLIQRIFILLVAIGVMAGALMIPQRHSEPEPEVKTKSKAEPMAEEILRSLKRMSKDWRPVVKGMQPATVSPPPLHASPSS